MNLVGALLVAVLIGAMLPLQGLVNARLGTHAGGPVVAAFVSFLVGTAMLGAYLLATRTPVTLQGASKWPAWIWAGGALGAIYVACFTLLIPRIGAAGMVCLAVLGQVTASLLLDQLACCRRPNRSMPCASSARCWCSPAWCWWSRRGDHRTLRRRLRRRQFRRIVSNPVIPAKAGIQPYRVCLKYLTYFK